MFPLTLGCRLGLYSPLVFVIQAPLVYSAERLIIRFMADLQADAGGDHCLVLAAQGLVTGGR